METAYEKFDFRSPSGLANESTGQLSDWFRQFRSLFTERWSNSAAQQMDVQFQSDKTVSFSNLKSQIDAATVAYLVDFATDAVTSMLYAKRSDLLNIVSGVISNGEEDQKVEDRPLTQIELNLAEMLFQEVVNSLSESWPSQDPLELKMQQLEPKPHRSRIYPPKQLMLVFTFQIQQGEFSGDLHWAIPQQEVEKLFDDSLLESDDIDAHARSQMESTIQDAAVKISVLLGHSEIRLSDLANISPGDVILLDQKVTEPVSVQVQEETKFLAWPGKNGDIQSIKISALV